MVNERLRRLLTILKLVQTGRATPDSLARECGLSRRTIFRDIEAIRTVGIPLVFNEEQRRYYLAQDFFLKSTHFTPAEALAVITLAYEIGDQSQFPFFAAARDAALKLVSLLPSDLKEYVAKIGDSVQYLVEPRNQLNEHETQFDLLLKAQSLHFAVGMTYQSPAEPDEMRLQLHPYVIFFSRRSWYVVGHSSLHEETRTFNVGRIREIALTGESFDVPHRFKLEEYLGNAWHLIPESGADSHVILRFSPKVAQNVSEVAWHKTQKIVPLDGGGIEFHATVSGVNEIAWWVLGYGKEVEVVSPLALRKIICQHVKAMTEIYTKPFPCVFESKS